MKIPMRTFQELVGNNPAPRLEPKLVGPQPVPDTGIKLKADDFVMDPHSRAGSPVTTENYHGSAVSELPKDVTGYPTHDKDAIDTGILEAKLAIYLSNNQPHVNNTVLQETATGLPMDTPLSIEEYISGNVSESCLTDIVETVTNVYKEQLADVTRYPDIPIIEAMDTFIKYQKLTTEACGHSAIDRIGRIQALENALQDSIAMATVEGGFCPNQRNMNELTPMDPSMRINSYPMYPGNAGERSIVKLIGDICEADTFEAMTECAITMSKMFMESNDIYTVVGESLVYEGARAREVSRKVRQAGRTGVRKAHHAIKAAETNVSKAIDPMEKFVISTKEKIRKADSAQRRNIILRGGIIPKLMRWLKRAMPISAGLIAGQAIPVTAVISVIAFIGWFVTDKNLDNKERNRIMKELEDEIEIVNEKIEDARGDANKQKKYELMRIRNKLNRTRDKIRYHLNTPVEDDVIKVNTKDKK